MNKTLLYIGFILIVLVVGVAIYTSQNTDSRDPNNQNNTFQQDSDESGNDENNQVSSQYIEYTPQNFELAADKKRVYFFHASWCPTCKAADNEFKLNGDKIPQDVVLFKTDYDQNDEIKKQFRITSQHTFVQVDEAGNEITQWNGGGIEELQYRIK